MGPWRLGGDLAGLAGIMGRTGQGLVHRVCGQLLAGAGRDALAEMRRLVGVMRADDTPEISLAPQPGLRHLDALIEQVEAAGLPVSLHIEGERPEIASLRSQ